MQATSVRLRIFWLATALAVTLFRLAAYYREAVGSAASPAKPAIEASIPTLAPTPPPTPERLYVLMDPKGFEPNSPMATTLLNETRDELVHKYLKEERRVGMSYLGDRCTDIAVCD